jgi:site-specific DNA-cytosine methylase
MYSPFGALNRHRGYAPTFGNLIPEYERCVAEARPDWFLMENVSRAPTPVVTGYQVTEQVLSNRELGEVQNRIRRISFGTKDGARLHIQHRPEPEAFARTVTAGSGGGNIIRSKYPLAQALKLQGLPADMLDQAPFTSHGKLKAVANGVPLPMGRSIARAVQLYLELREINKALGRGAQRASGILVDAA